MHHVLSPCLISDHRRGCYKLGNQLPRGLTAHAAAVGRIGRSSRSSTRLFLHLTGVLPYALVQDGRSSYCPTATAAGLPSVGSTSVYMRRLSLNPVSLPEARCCSTHGTAQTDSRHGSCDTGRVWPPTGRENRRMRNRTVSCTIHHAGVWCVV